jgi:hypothetical protein
MLQAIFFYAVFVIPSFFAPGGSAVFGMAALTVYSVTSPAALLFGTPFWRTALFSAVFWIVLLALIQSTCEALIGQSLGDDAMVFLLPFMVFPVALLVSTLGRFLLLRSRAVSSGGGGKSSCRSPRV